MLIRKLTAAVLAILFAITTAPARAAITLHSNGQSTLTNAPAVILSTVGDSLAVACVIGDQGQGTGKTVSDNRGNTWTRVATPITAGGTHIELWYALVTNANVTTTVTYSGNFSYIAVATFAGTATSSVTDGSPTGTSATFSTSVQPGSITPSQANGLLISCFGADLVGGTPVVNAPFAFTNSINTSSQQGGLSYVIQTSAIAANPTFSGYSTTTSMANMQAFKESGGGGGGSTFTNKLLIGAGH